MGQTICRGGGCPNELQKLGINDFLDFRSVTYFVKRNDPAYFVISISRNYYRFLTQLTVLSFAMFLTIFSLIHQLWFIFTFGIFWAFCTFGVMRSSLFVFYRTWCFKQESVQISSKSFRDTWSATCRTWGIFGPSTRHFSKCEGSALGKKRVHASSSDYYVVNYISFNHHTGQVALWCEADKPSRDKSLVHRKLCESFGAEDEVDPLDIVVYKEPSDGPTHSEGKIQSLSRKIFIKEVRVDMLFREKPSKLDPEAYSVWKTNYDAAQKSLDMLRDILREYPRPRNNLGNIPARDFKREFPIRKILECETGLKENNPTETRAELETPTKNAEPIVFPPIPSFFSDEEIAENEIIFE